MVWEEATHPTKTLNGLPVRRFPPKCGGIYVYSNVYWARWWRSERLLTFVHDSRIWPHLQLSLVVTWFSMPSPHLVISVGKGRCLRFSSFGDYISMVRCTHFLLRQRFFISLRWWVWTTFHQIPNSMVRSQSWFWRWKPVGDQKQRSEDSNEPSDPASPCVHLYLNYSIPPRRTQISTQGGHSIFSSRNDLLVGSINLAVRMWVLPTLESNVWWRFLNRSKSSGYLQTMIFRSFWLN